MIEKPGFALGNQKIVKYFEHGSKQFVRIEDQVGWNKRDALLTFHLARIAYLLFPENIPYPRLVRKSSTKPDTYSIFAEYIPHDEEHKFITSHRNKNVGSNGYMTQDDVRRFRKMIGDFENNEEAKKLRVNFKLSGLIGPLGGGYELIKQNVIIKGNKNIYIDFINPFAISENELEQNWFPRVDFSKIINYTKEHCDPETQEIIFRELRNIHKLMPENIQETHKQLLQSGTLKLN